jgi:glutathione S-transferase
MNAYPLTSLITLLTVLLMFVTSVIVGKARVKYSIMAPATSGHEMFDRAYRVQMNTMEAALMMLPALWIYAVFNGEIGAFAMGVIWLLGRAWYAQAYLSNPARRGLGFGIAFVTLAGLWFGALMGLALRGVLLF